MGFGKSVKKTYMKAKKKAYGERGVTGRYYRVGAVKGLQNLAKDVEMIKSRLNVEKKYKDADVATTSVGQVVGNSDGLVWYDVTPDITQGIDSDERIGNSLKLTGLTFPIQFSQQVSCFGARKVRVSLLRVTSADNGVDGNDATGDYWDKNPISLCRDYNAPKAYRNQKTDGIKCVRTMTVFVPAPITDNATAGTVDNTEVNSKSVRMSVKLEDIFRYNDSSATKPDGIRYFLVFQCDSGNRSSSNSTLDVPVTTNSSGLVMRLAQRSWWVDN